jgi:F0F1-type ATP synthase assembly protein I
MLIGFNFVLRMMIGAIVTGWIIGVLLDLKLHTSPYWQKICFIYGCIISLIWILTWILDFLFGRKGQQG